MIFLKEKNIAYVKTNVYCSNKEALEAWKKLGFRELSKNMIRKIQT